MAHDHTTATLRAHGLSIACGLSLTRSRPSHAHAHSQARATPTSLWVRVRVCVCASVPPLVSDPLPDAHIRSQIRAATHVLPHGPAPPGTAAGGVLRHGTATACRARRRVACVRAAICEEQPALGMPSPVRRRRPQDHDLVLSQHHQRLTANLARGRVDAWPRQRPHSSAGARAGALARRFDAIRLVVVLLHRRQSRCSALGSHALARLRRSRGALRPFTGP